MKFMNTKYAIRTCILSKRWKHLWKHLTALSLDGCDFRTNASYNKFVSNVLSGRDGSISLLHIDFKAYSTPASIILNRVMKHAAVMHNVQHLTITVVLIPNCFVPLIFSLQSLTFLEIHVLSLKLTKSLHLPALKSLYLSTVSFTASDNDCAEPFSSCDSLNTLDNSQHKIVLSTPNLSSFTITDNLGFSTYHLSFSSTCNLSFLEEGNIHIDPHNIYSAITGWLQLLSNVKILTLSLATVKIILNTLKVKMDPSLEICDEEINGTVEYLLQNSPMIRVAV
ncbi:F-box/FBD/LRR-repeat protein, partial [Mucuna pruriens]